MKQFQLKYLVMDQEIYQDNRLSWLQGRLVAFISSYTGDQFYFTNEQLASMFKATVRGIEDALAKLQEYGYIDRIVVGKSNGGTYRVIHKRERLIPKVVHNQPTSPTPQRGSPPRSDVVHPHAATWSKDNSKSKYKRSVEELRKLGTRTPTTRSDVLVNGLWYPSDMKGELLQLYGQPRNTTAGQAESRPPERLHARAGVANL